MIATPTPHLRSSTVAAGERGVVLIVSLLLLVVMLISAAALMRSTDISLFQAGNIAFKRDLTHQAERASQAILDTFLAGGDLDDQVKRSNHIVAQNYSAIALPTNPRGIPQALLVDDTAFALIGTAGKDIDLPDQGVRIRYVVDRMCTDVGLDTVLGSDRCALADNNSVRGGSARKWQRAEFGSIGGAGANPQSVVYRLSIRVTGPRNTQGFYQTTFTI